MNATDVESLIESGIENAEVTVSSARHEEDEDHLAAVVVSPAFEDVRLVDRHKMVYDAVGEAMTREIHALEIKAYTPGEYESQQ